MITTRGLTKTFTTRNRAGKNTVDAVRGVDINVEAGELVGFLGPNGAGKTTTLRMLTTLLQPTSGHATVAGCDLGADPVGVRRRIGYVSQAGGTTPDSRVGEELVLQGRFYGLSKSAATSRAHDLFEQLDLVGLAERKCKTLSGGQRRRLDIAMGLIHEPELVFLDEPSTGLDPQSRANLWGHIKALRDIAGTTVFLTTHYLDEADALSDRIIIIDNGQIVAEGTPDSLKATVSGDGVTFTVPTDQAARAVEIANAVDGAHEVSANGGDIRMRVARGDVALPGLLRALDSENIAMAAMSVQRPTLDDVFLTMTGRSLREAEAEQRPPAQESNDVA